MPPDRPLPSRKDFTSKSLVRLPISSSLGSVCSICQEVFNEDHEPVCLKPRGHVFGRECILVWLDSGRPNANTCPMDRTELFRIPASEAALTTRPRRNAQTSITPTQGGEITGVNGTLTNAGCRRVVLELWYETWGFFRDAEMREVDALSVDEGVLRGVIDGAIPRGMEVPQRAWGVLVSIGRQMLAMHSEAERGSDALLRSELLAWAGELGRAGIEILESRQRT
ncbi:hypothetical protein BU26DRAFT_562489 [Trematosphaeria pertusa]|uniref:RING-type domain-containing protein n=1 Tax=Trematosphaeria pertusa TaxID=390896 RepID=A0A6A6IJV3_9PLEO|nr:uncharacterized protein BU26DRAFT_562489 [Trematosphaeria pertusa]KAF2250509.1 hypothetical protein BU26DRAFT_562489 [Trematosphaeria pertusa]